MNVYWELKPWRNLHLEKEERQSQTETSVQHQRGGILKLVLLNSLFPFVPTQGDSGYEIRKETSLTAKVDPFYKIQLQEPGLAKVVEANNRDIPTARSA